MVRRRAVENVWDCTNDAESARIVLACAGNNSEPFVSGQGYPRVKLRTRAVIPSVRILDVYLTRWMVEAEEAAGDNLRVQLERYRFHGKHVA